MKGVLKLMVMDIIVFAILIATIFFSMRRGFALTLTNFFGGIVSVVIGWIFSDDLAEILFKETFVGTWLTDKLHDGLVQSWQNSEIYQALPALLREESNSGTSWTDSDLITTGSEKLVMFFLTVISFFLIVIGLRLVIGVLKSGFSKKNKGGFTGFIDWLLGLLMGIVLGILNVMIFLALLPAVLGIFCPDMSESLVSWFSGSYAAQDLYDNNLLLVLMRDL